MSVSLGLLLVGLGATGGFFAGLLGLGGAIVMFPLLLYVARLPVRVVAGITMVQVLFASLSGAIAHRHHHFVNRDLVLYMGGGIVCGSFAGAWLSVHFSPATLKIIFASMAFVAAVMMLLPQDGLQAEGPSGAISFNPFLAVVAALIVGFFSGAVGAGGTFILVPIMIYLLRIPTRVTIGTSLAIAVLSASAGFLGKLGSGQIEPFLATALVVGAMPGAQMGALVSQRLKVRLLRTLLAVIIALTAIKMWTDILF